MKRSYTPNHKWEEQYLREYNRIKQAIRRQEKLGYVIPEEVKPKHPSKVKNITKKEVESLIELTPQSIRKQSVFVDKDTGEGFVGLDIVKSYHKARPSRAKVSVRKAPKSVSKTTETKPNKPRKKRTKKEQQTAPPKENNLNKQIIDTISNILNSWQIAPYWRGSFLERKTMNYHKLSALWKETLANEDEYEVAYRIESHATEIINLVERLLYSSDSAVDDDFNMSRFIELIIGRPLTAFESDMYTEMAREQAMDTLRGENSVG